MPTRRPLAVILAAMSIVAALVAGCSSSSKQSSGPLPDAATLLTESSQATKNVKSVHLVLSVIGKIQGLPIQTLTGDLTTAPTTAVTGNAKFTLGGAQIDANFVIVDAVLYAALTPNRWSTFGPAADLYDPSTILNPDTGLANMLAHVTDPKAQGRDTIDGQDVVRVAGTIAPDAVNPVLPLNATQSLPVTVWIQENGEHELVQAKLDQSPGNAIQATLSNWGEPVRVTKPPTSG